MFGFWIFVSVVWICDVYMYMNGHDGVLLKAKTSHEQRLREAVVQKQEKLAGIDDDD